MRNVITNELDKCTGCNRCLRVCPIDEANITVEREGKILIEIDNSKCIACGACLPACHHGSRQFEDDTEQFFADLRSGVPITLITAPATKSNVNEWGRMLSWFRNEGVQRIYDVSLGADICVWGHIRYIQKYGPGPLITQPCPSIVSYIVRHKNELIKYLSPVQSPIGSLAVFMKKYEGVTTKIAAITPCIAKRLEFESTGLVDYNITIKNLSEYIEKHRIVFPAEASGFDSYEAGLGSLFPMPGGLKENIEYYLGKTIRIDKAEGPETVYKKLDEYAEQPESRLPVIYDVLNCGEGCNLGTGTRGDKNIFQINTSMDNARQASIREGHTEYLDDLYKKFDERFRLDDFLRTYDAAPVQMIKITHDDIERAFIDLGKLDDFSRQFNCGSCGCDTCLEMAQKIAKGVNTIENCVVKARNDIQKEQSESISLQAINLNNIETIFADTTLIKELTENIVSDIDNITEAISVYNSMIRDIEKIAMQVNIIALNASIEAARAGRHGKAFNVVAEEIRTLAQSSSNSAQQTNEASEKATDAINSVNKMVMKISENVNASYEHIAEITENTKKLLGHDISGDDDNEDEIGFDNYDSLREV